MSIARFEAGADVRYGITSNLALDVSYNTDFAQVEADQEQVNLTQFSQFFPEKREFFLEGAQLFDFGEAASTRGGDVRPPTLLFLQQENRSGWGTARADSRGWQVGRQGRAHEYWCVKCADGF